MSSVADLSNTTQQIEALLFFEAQLLDEGRFHEWLDLFTEDCTYRMPLREFVQGAVRNIQETHFGLYDEDKSSLKMRVRRFDTGLAHVELPPSITQHLITNIRVEKSENGNEYIVRSNFLVFQLRHETKGDIFVGSRLDKIRLQNGKWYIAARTITLAQPILPRALSIFF